MRDREREREKEREKRDRCTNRELKKNMIAIKKGSKCTSAKKKTKERAILFKQEEETKMRRRILEESLRERKGMKKG